MLEVGQGSVILQIADGNGRKLGKTETPKEVG